MAKLSKPERDRKQSGSLAKEFHLTDEDKFKGPTLTEMYWSNPNLPKGTISTCSYVKPLKPTESKRKEGT